MKRPRSLCIAALVLLGTTFAVFAAPPADFPYALDPLLDGGLLVGGLAVYGGSLYLAGLKPGPDQSAANAGSIPFFDRAYPAKPSVSLSAAGNDLALGMALLPVLTFPGRSSSEIFTIGTMYAETLELAYSMDSLLKSVVVRYRPYAYSTATPADFSNSDITASFPSSHATLAFSAAVFTGVVFDRLNPDSRYRALVWVSGLGLATAASALRVLSADHFVSDVVAGGIIGAASGFLIPFFHERTAEARGIPGASSFEVEPTPGGFVARLSLAP